MKPLKERDDMHEPILKTKPHNQIPHRKAVSGRSPAAIESRVRPPGLCLLFLLLVASLASATEIRLESFADRKTAYSVNPGQEFPGGKTGLVWILEGYHSEGALSVDYDFS